jgi:hypothetical protein
MSQSKHEMPNWLQKGSTCSICGSWKISHCNRVPLSMGDLQVVQYGNTEIH